MNSELPGFPIELLNAINNKRLILFLGAGVSCNAGARGWTEISKSMLEDFKNKKIIEDNEFSELHSTHYYAIFERLSQKSPDLYKEKFLEYLYVKDLKIINRYKSLVNKLKQFNPVSIVTTNMDNLIMDSNLFGKEKIYYKNSCHPQNIINDGIFCIHGNLKDNIFILSEKIRYYSTSNDLRFFLHNIFGSFCILFLGYGLDREDILHHYYVNSDYLNKELIYHHAIVPSDCNLSETDYKMRYNIKLHKYSNNDGLRHQNFEKTIDFWLSNIPWTPLEKKSPLEVDNNARKTRIL